MHATDTESAAAGVRTAVYLKVVSDDLPPAEITALVEVEPDQAWSKGEPIPGSRSARTARFNYWQFDSGAGNDDDVVEHVSALQARLGEAARRFALLPGASVSIELQIVRWHCEEGKLLLGLNLSRELVAFARLLNASIDIDEYVGCGGRRREAGNRA